jgi:hypothetical protein
MKKILVILLFLCILTNPVSGIKPIVLMKETHLTIPFSGFLVGEDDMLKIYSIMQREKMLNKILLQQEEYFMVELKKLKKQTKVYFWEKPAICFFAGMFMSIAMMFGAAKIAN